MIIGHSVGVAAAVAAQNRTGAGGSVDVNSIDLAHLHTLLVADGQKLNVSGGGQPNPPPPTKFDGSVCELGRCFQVDSDAANQSTHHYDNATCGEPHADCSELAPNEWLAMVLMWDVPNAVVGAVITAKTNTYLKKSTLHSNLLPPNMVMTADKGFKCRLVSADVFDNYRLCTPVNATL